MQQTCACNAGRRWCREASPQLAPAPPDPAQPRRPSQRPPSGCAPRPAAPRTGYLRSQPAGGERGGVKWGWVR